MLEHSKLKMYGTTHICFDMNIIKTLIFLNRYTLYALLKDAFGERVRMLYTDTDSFF